jgi:hypothetical protein
MTQQITPEMVAAWRTLQAFALRVRQGSHQLAAEAAEAVDALDNSNFMVPIEETGLCTYQVGGGYGSLPEYCEAEIEDDQEYCPKHQRLADADSQLDPGEWGDTTRADMAGHQSGSQG